MKSALNFALPEDLLCVSKEAEAGIPIDAITCAIDRASSVLPLLEDHFEGDTPRLSNHIIASVLWDVRGTLGLIRTLAMHADTASNQSDSAGGAKSILPQKVTHAAQLLPKSKPQLCATLIAYSLNGCPTASV